MASSDIKSMYLNVKLAPECTKYFGFQVPDINGKPMYFEMTRVPFGYGPATYEMNELVRPIQIKLHKIGVDASCYIDDNFNTGQTLVRCDSYDYLTVTFFGMSGWQMSASKCVPATTKILYLGFFIDSVLMRVFAPQIKIVRLIVNIDIVLRTSDVISNRDLASILGTLAHLLISHGNCLRLASRSSQHSLGNSVMKSDWNGYLSVTPQMVSELTICKTFLYSANGQPINTVRRDFHVIRPAPETYSIDNFNPSDEDRELIKIVSDASDRSSFVYEADTFRIVREYPFSLDEQSASSTLRELLSVERLFTQDNNYIQSIKGSTLAWLTDNSALTWILTRGSRREVLQNKLLKIAELQLKYGK